VTTNSADVNGIRDKAAIIGIGETEFSFDSGRSELQLASEAIKAACDDAGISPHDIDGLIRYEMDTNLETMVVQSLGIKNLRHWESVSYGGGGGQRRGGPCRCRYLCRILQLRCLLPRCQSAVSIEAGSSQKPRSNRWRPGSLCSSIWQHGSSTSVQPVCSSLHA